MPPYCEEHARYHADPEQCHRMREAARRLAADKARDKINREKAERIADRLIDDYANATDRPDDLQLVRGLLADAALAALTEKENA